MSKSFQLYVVSVDFDTTAATGRPHPPYIELERLLNRLGGVLKPTHQIRMLISPLKAKTIRDRIQTVVLEGEDRVYVGKIARGSAWCNLLRISSKDLKTALRKWAKSSEPPQDRIDAAYSALSERLPRRKS